MAVNQKSAVLKSPKPAINFTRFGHPHWAAVLNLLIPGLGHLFWREYLFGVFVFLVCLLAVIIAVMSLFLPLSNIATSILLGLPAIFYTFTFFDAFRTARRNRGKVVISNRRFTILVVVGIGYQLIAPSAPLNFALYNWPDYFMIDSNDLSPKFIDGDLVKASGFAYRVNLALLPNPIMHELPSRYDIIRFVDDGGQKRIGIVIGLPDEAIVLVAGRVLSGGMLPVEENPPLPLAGDWPLTYAGPQSMLVADVRLGYVRDVREIQLHQVIGRVSKALQ